MIIGLVIFLCIVFSILLFYAGYIVGVRYITMRLLDAWFDVLTEYRLAPDMIEKLFNRLHELFTKRIKEE